MRTLLIVDDVEMNRELLEEILEDDFDTILQAENGYQALELIEQHEKDIDAILLDLVMPELDGFGVLERLKEKYGNKQLPILIISALESEAERDCFRYGISDFVHKPFDFEIVRRRVLNAAQLYTYQTSLENKVAEQTHELREKNERLHRVNMDTVESIGRIVDARDLGSGEHIHRVKEYTRILTACVKKELPDYGITDEEEERIVNCSPLHDVGKITVRDAVLLKPGRFTPEEYEEMKRHTIHGCDVIESLGEIWSPEFRKTAREIARWHHERFDGRGYPDQLTGDEIPISAQIVAVADVYDALINTRPYKDSLPKDKACEMIKAGECGAFNPKLMHCFEMVRDRFAEVQ